MYVDCYGGCIKYCKWNSNYLYESHLRVNMNIVEKMFQKSDF